MAISRRIRGRYLLVVRFSTDNGERQDVSPPILERTWCAGKSTVVRSRAVEPGLWHPTVARQSRAGGGDRCRVPRRRLIPVLP